jgi:uncharacterized Fe-S cluster protein YjdI/CDGSH-type Zn-finger protein
MTKKYTNKDITVVWQPKLCIHSQNCFKGLKEVFNPAQSPWVNIEAADTSAIVNQVGKCPSGALSYYKNEDEQMSEKKTEILEGSVIYKKEPAQTLVEGGKPYLWCACGRSVDQPFCDNSHNLKSDLKPRMFKEEKGGEVWLCQCKQTKNPPYCDGTHNSL